MSAATSGDVAPWQPVADSLLYSVVPTTMARDGLQAPSTNGNIANGWCTAGASVGNFVAAHACAA
uniref:Uncharacterized protein n=1 Tax=Oryza meridionalis TaxID=40149 RepID=A0A0E0CL37_9ORYZ